jgi:hypothetical protein
MRHCRNDRGGLASGNPRVQETECHTLPPISLLQIQISPH